MVAPFNQANAFDLSHDTKLTCNMGTLIPCFCEEVCPGDVFKWQADVFLRLMPMLAPIMQDIDVYIHMFNVPNRLIFKGFEDFITGGKDGKDDQLWPYIKAPEGGFKVGSLADYLGCATGVAGIEVSALPFRAYDLIYNEWYRDQNLIDPVTISQEAGLDTTTLTDILRRAWRKDYFTGGLPWAQRGDPVYLPLGLSAPVVGNNKQLGLTLNGSEEYTYALGHGASEDIIYSGKYTGGTLPQTGEIDQAGRGYTFGLSTDPNKSGVYADLRQATALSVNDLRVSIQIQRFLEKNARGGARYIEWLLSHFGVRSSDARLQRPEYLGGGRCPINITEVLQTSSTDSTSPQGNMAGRGSSYQNMPSFTKHFEEYGWVIGLLSIVPKASYQQGIRRQFTRKTRYDYPLPVFAHLGNQEVKNKEIYAQGTEADERTFTYQERYEELRRIPSSVHGHFRDTLDFWHLGRKFVNPPQFNQQFIECNPSKRCFAVTDESEDCCIVKVDHHLIAIRRFPKFGDPGYMDHD